MEGFMQPQEVSDVEMAFGSKTDKLLPPYGSIPEEFKRSGNEWVEWQSEWFYSGLKDRPVPKEGVDETRAMRHLSAIQRSFRPKHEHKMAGVAYLASLWFSAPHPKKTVQP